MFSVAHASRSTSATPDAVRNAALWAVVRAKSAIELPRSAEATRNDIRAFQGSKPMRNVVRGFGKTLGEWLVALRM